MWYPALFVHGAARRPSSNSDSESPRATAFRHCSPPDRFIPLLATDIDAQYDESENQREGSLFESQLHPFGPALAHAIHEPGGLLRLQHPPVANCAMRRQRRKIVRFSVLMPFFNEEKYICRAIESVLNQNFTDFELIVIDDGSTDGSLQHARSYEPRLRILCQSHQGPEVARNKAAAIAKGEYLVFLDADDFFFPFALAILDRVI